MNIVHMSLPLDYITMLLLLNFKESNSAIHHLIEITIETCNNNINLTIDVIEC